MYKYKSILSEKCTLSQFDAPEYRFVQIGKDHAPIFKAEVEVKGKKFHSTPPFHRTKQVAFDVVAKMAYEHLFTDSLPDDAERKKLKKMEMADNAMMIPPREVKLMVYTSIPEDALPDGKLFLEPAGEGAWRIVRSRYIPSRYRNFLLRIYIA
ncbi:double-stranded RNA-binding protein 1 isoform X2 [Tanacetum coccineum]